MTKRSTWKLLAATLVLGGCYGSFAEQDAAHDAGDDGSSDDGVTPDTDADAGDDGARDDGDADADVPEVVGTCGEPPDGLWFDFTVDDGSYEAVTIDAPCRIEDVEDTGGGQRVTLLCGTGAVMTTHRLEVWGSVGLYFDLWRGSEVWFRYVADPVWWLNRHLTLRWAGGESPGELMFAAISADAAVPDGYDAADWYGPWTVDVISGLCEPTTGSCGTFERQAIQLGAYGSTVRVLNGGTGHVGMMVAVSLSVTQAYRYSEMLCDDAPNQFYTALFVQIPEG